MDLDTCQSPSIIGKDPSKPVVGGPDYKTVVDLIKHVDTLYADDRKYSQVVVGALLTVVVFAIPRLDAVRLPSLAVAVLVVILLVALDGFATRVRYDVQRAIWISIARKMEAGDVDDMMGPFLSQERWSKALPMGLPISWLDRRLYRCGFPKLARTYITVLALVFLAVAMVFMIR